MIVPLRALVFFVLLSLLSYSIIAGPSKASPSPTLAAAAPSFDVEAATQRYLDTLTPAQKAKSDAYFEGGYWLLLWGVLYNVAVAGVFLGLGLSARIRGWLRGIRSENLRNLLYAALYTLLAAVLSFPWTIYTGFFREHQYGLSNQTFGAWFSESLIGLVLSVVIGSLLIMLLYLAIRKVGASWWLWGTGLTVIFLVIGVFLAPIFISPLFNKYTPLPPSPVRESILSMARANLVPATNVYLVDASRQSKRISANVSGLGSTIRISLNDNLLKRSTPAEIQGVMGHELGHYVLNHIVKGLIFFSLLVLIGFALVNWAFRRLVARYGARWNVSGLADIGGLPLLLVLFSVYSFLITPATNTITRVSEMEADQFGLNAAQQPDGFASIAMKLSEYRKISPGYWEEIFFFDHPSGHTRVHTAMQWKAEHLGDKP
ncbi:M48 family metallopeptidase [Hymenobacter sp. GOD-10R]|uniref:M48 family metallopeptidase n=1 Tax=Hymenobacter sp. GOD-10R TaxID=3093922 RepID=UPI002D79D66F|nr:M48 family metallopeptidase [Hymenobacter sp. GOD-10R]WRQ30181.1 M48 family metallopeptidase [Hymenobacter sp. GOD-10R]